MRTYIHRCVIVGSCLSISIGYNILFIILYYKLQFSLNRSHEIMHDIHDIIYCTYNLIINDSIYILISFREFR